MHWVLAYRMKRQHEVRECGATGARARHAFHPKIVHDGFLVEEVA
jgi:hypothetical protein